MVTDPKPETNKNHPYRYSIQHLIELSTAAYIPFDLSKFTYDAARAGVVPPLGKCIMSSRKSSATSRFRNSSGGTASGDDLVDFANGNSVRPSRQPSNPPAAHRQQDEGFAKFLKKHTSPSHNRVTAGGRIVPMERPSPPVFSLVSDKPSKPPAATNLRGIDVNKRMLPTNYGKPTVQDRAVHCPNYQASAREFKNPNLMISTVDHDHNPDLRHRCFPEVPIASAIPSSMLYDGATGGWFSRPVRSPCHATTSQGCFANTPLQGYPSAFSTNGFNALPNALDCFDAHGASVYEALNATTINVDAPPTTTNSLHNTLAQWQQHYAELDQQLRDMDRHRAMVNLDPLLVQQRRIIVQQRSDARDTIKQLKDALGLCHSTDSSQDSLDANFNVDAPVYIPHIYASQFQGSHATFMPVQTTSAIVHSKAQLPSGSRAVPIKAPPTVDRNMVDSSHKSTPRAGTRAPNTQVSNKPSKVNAAPFSENSRHASIVSEEAEQFSSMSRGAQHHNNGDARPYSVIARETAESHKPTKVSSEIPHDTKQEYFELLKAVSRAKGVITSVTLVDGRQIDVEGQGLGLISTSDTDNEEFDGSDLATHCELTNREVQGHDPFANCQPQICGETRKENISIQPQAHRKSATDAFLTHFNTAESDPASGKHLITQSDCGSNSAHLGITKLMRSVHPTVLESCKAVYKDSKMNGQARDSTCCPATQSSVQSKGVPSASLQNVHAVYRRHTADNSDDKKLDTQPPLATTDKNKSPRLLRRQTGVGRGWLAPFWRDSNDREASPTSSPSKNCFK